MKLLVTGGAGFIGSNFIHYWMQEHPEDQISNLDALTYAGNQENLIDLEALPNYTFIHGDIRDADTVAEAMKGVDIVVHFAAESHVDRSIMDPSSFVTTNVVGTQVLLNAARRAQVRRFHHISTDEVFGTLSLQGDAKFSETTPYDPHSPYSASKAGSDHLVRAYGDTFGLPISITNCSNNYGPYQFPEKFMSLAITNIMEGKKVPVYGNGLQVRDWLHVIDHCRAIEAVLLRGKAGGTYCVGGMSKDVPNIEIVKMILNIMGKGEDMIDYVADRPGHDVRYAVDWSKIHRELGWSPSLTLEDGLRDMVSWYMKNESWWRHIKSGEYQTYYQNQYNLRRSL